jgi:hypothetical protein
MMRDPEVVFNMDLANAPTTARFCFAAADVLGQKIDPADRAILEAYESQDFSYSESADEICKEWDSRLWDAGYVIEWNAGDVVVWDLRPLSPDDRDAFLDAYLDAFSG